MHKIFIVLGYKAVYTVEIQRDFRRIFFSISHALKVPLLDSLLVPSFALSLEAIRAFETSFTFNELEGIITVEDSSLHNHIYGIQNI